MKISARIAARSIPRNTEIIALHIAFHGELWERYPSPVRKISRDFEPLVAGRKFVPVK